MNKEHTNIIYLKMEMKMKSKITMSKYKWGQAAAHFYEFV